MFWFFVSKTSGETKVVPAWGIDDPRAPDSLEPVVEFKNFTGLDPMIVAWRENFSQRFPMEKCARVQAAGYLPLIMWDVDPGDSYVDFLALDGLDFGDESSASLPLSFEQLFASPVRRLRILARNKPILLTEVGTASVGVFRERWILEMANVPSALKDHPVLNLDSRFVTLVGHNLEKDGRLAARIRFGWNPTALIIWCEVDDSTVGDGRLEPEKIWDGDAVELDLGPPSDERSARMKGCKRRLVWSGGAHYYHDSSEWGRLELLPSGE